MAVLTQHKVVVALPSPLEPDAVYYVRTGVGYDQFVTNGAGQIVAYPMNTAASSVTIRATQATGVRLRVVGAGGGVPVYKLDGSPLTVVGA